MAQTNSSNGLGAYRGSARVTISVGAPCIRTEVFRDICLDKTSVTHQPFLSKYFPMHYIAAYFLKARIVEPAEKAVAKERSVIVT
jgi:hypothetical protein